MAAPDNIIQTGNWGKHISWQLVATDQLPPAELCTAVMCVAITGDKVVLACGQRGWGMLGGHVEDDEDIEEALAREALEEGGFTIAHHQLFAVRKITASQPMPHQKPGKEYPYPVSYIVYYWATTAQPLLPPTGEEIIESRAFTVDELESLETPDLAVIRVGWDAHSHH